MKWKRLTFRIMLVTISLLIFCIALPNVSVCAEQPDPKKLASIETVVSKGEGPATELSITLSSPATFTSYKKDSPLRLVIDLSQVTQGSISDPVNINKGNFKTVRATRYDTEAGVLTRLEIDLVDDSEAVISTLSNNPRELKVSFPELVENAAAAIKKESIIMPPSAEEPKASDLNQVPVNDNGESFRTLTAISVNKNEITLALDGPISSFKTFRLNKPERYVLDLMNVKSGLSARLLPLNISGVSSARIGLYPDKLRIVFDAVNGSFPEATALKTNDGVLISLDTKPVIEDVKPEPASIVEEKRSDVIIPVEEKNNASVAKQETDKQSEKLEKPLEVKPETVKQAGVEEQAANMKKKPLEVSTIEMIDFQVLDGISRVSIKVNGDINAEQPVKSSGYVTLILKNTTLPKNLQRSLETRSFVTPILRITPLSVKTKKGTNTKIRVVTRIPAAFEYRQEGDMVYLDFKHPAGLSGNKLIIEATDYENKLAQQKTAATAEDDISSDLSPVVESAGKPADTSRVFKGRKVTLEFADADVRKIFQLLSEVSGKNFILGDDVTGNISLKLVNVPWDQALYIIMDTKELESRESGNVLTIKKKGKFKSAMDEELEIKKALARSIELKTETFSVNYSDVAAISSQFNGLKTDRGVISTDARTGSVIVKDVPMALDDMRKLLKQLDVPERQVMIEARIVEATSTFTRSLGVNWGVHYRDGSSSFLGINQMDTSFGGLAAAAPTSGASGQPGAAMGISFGTLTSNIALDLRLNAAASAGLIKIISSPKVATLNHKPAKISQGQAIPYTSSTSDKIETKFIQATLSLDVTPHINANGTIVMKIDAKNDAPGTGSPPSINTKQATTELLLRDGETTVIGGIFVDSEQESDDGVPFLMDIPLLGKLFSSNSKSKTKTELLIFVTPRILSGI